MTPGGSSSPLWWQLFDLRFRSASTDLVLLVVGYGPRAFSDLLASTSWPSNHRDALEELDAQAGGARPALNSCVPMRPAPRAVSGSMMRPADLQESSSTFAQTAALALSRDGCGASSSRSLGSMRIDGFSLDLAMRHGTLGLVDTAHAAKTWAPMTVPVIARRHACSEVSRTSAGLLAEDGPQQLLLGRELATRPSA